MGEYASKGLGAKGAQFIVGPLCGSGAIRPLPVTTGIAKPEDVNKKKQVKIASVFLKFKIVPSPKLYS